MSDSSLDIAILNNELIRRIVDSVCGIYKSNILEIILYGFVARRENHEFSDLDVALIIKSENSEMMDAFVDLDLEYDQVISPALIEADHFEKWKNVLPYYANIRNEGIVLWKAA